MQDADIERAHIKGQLQGLRAALRQQPANGVGLPPVAGATPPAFSPRAPSLRPPIATPPQPAVPPPSTDADERSRQLELQLKQAQLELQLKDAQAAAREEAHRREMLERELKAAQQVKS